MEHKSKIKEYKEARHNEGVEICKKEKKDFKKAQRGKNCI